MAIAKHSDNTSHSVYFPVNGAKCGPSETFPLFIYLFIFKVPNTMEAISISGQCGAPQGQNRQALMPKNWTTPMLKREFRDTLYLGYMCTCV